MKQDKIMSNRNGISKQESCPECHGDLIPKPTKSSRSQCLQCGWTKTIERPSDDTSLQARTLYVSETYFDELTEKQENKDLTKAQREETKRIFSDPDLFEARVEEIMKDLKEKTTGILADPDRSDGDNEEEEEAKEEIEELE